MANGTLRDIALAQNPVLIMSHLACADEPEHGMSAFQLRTFREMTDGIDVPRSLSATGGILMGEDYHFDVTRPGIGVYGGMPFADAQRVVELLVPVIQTREVTPGESVGYGNAWGRCSQVHGISWIGRWNDGDHNLYRPQ